MPNKKLTGKHKLKHCPNCRSRNLKCLHIISRTLPWWWHIECFNCHWSGKAKLFLKRAIKSWNKENKKRNEVNR